MRGFITEFKWLAHCKAFLDGEDVSARCAGVDEERGLVFLVARDEDGRNLIMPEIGITPARHVLYQRRGRVELVVSYHAAPATQEITQHYLDLERARQREHGYQGAYDE